VQNKEAHLCTTQWKEGYNPAVHRRYPRKLSSVDRSVSGSSERSTTFNAIPEDAIQEQLPIVCTDRPKTQSTDATPAYLYSIGQLSFLDMTITPLLINKYLPAVDSDLMDQSLKYVRSTRRGLGRWNVAVCGSSPTMIVTVSSDVGEEMVRS
jgi:hypothetical protein